MYLFHNRPLAFACMAFLGAAFLSYFLNSTNSLFLSLFLFLVAAVFGVIYLVKKKRIFFLLCLCLVFSCTAAFSSAFLLHSRCEKYEAMIDKEVAIEGHVLSVRTTQYGAEELEVALYLLDGEMCYDSVYLRPSRSTKFNVGDALKAQVVFESFRSTEMYDARAAALSDGIFAVASVAENGYCERLESGRFSLRATMLAWRTALSERLLACVGEEEGALCTAFLLGDKSFLSSDTTLHFRRVGVSHLLALSGLHVSVLIAFLEFVLRKLWCPRTVRAVVVILLSVAYLLLTGCSLSTVRAVLMCSVLMLSFLFRESYDSFTSVSVVLVLILLFSPWALTDLGMWMSFLAAGGIIVFQPMMSRLRDALHRWKKAGVPFTKAMLAFFSALFVGLIANLTLAPIQGFLFGELPLLSIPTTMLLSLPLTVTLILSMCTLAIPPLSGLCRIVAGGILRCTEALSQLEGTVLPLNDACSYVILFCLVLSLVAIAICKLKHLFLWSLIPIALGISLIPCSLLVTHLCFDRVEASYVVADSGSGEALVIAKEGNCIVVDLSAEDVGAIYGIQAAIKEARCTEVGDLLLTAYAINDADMLRRLSGKTLIRRLCLPMPQNEREAVLAEEIEAEARLHGIEVQYSFDDLRIAEITDLQMLNERPPDKKNAPILFSFSCAQTRLTYANGAFVGLGAGTLQYRALLDDTEVMIHGGRRTEKGRFFSTFPSLHTLILKDESHKDGFSWELLGRGALTKSRKYVFG
ncbi:MAG: ComEC family competence protein [Ruminococcaceae bacterium]|nr:ComEC family competence protein [Oscillospiraceae bacterium]